MNKFLIFTACLFFVSFSGAFSQQLFENWTNCPVEIGPVSIFAADLDLDGDLDLAVGYAGWPPHNRISVLKNNGDATFTPRINYTTGISTRSIFGADLDGDGDVDLVVANQGEWDIPDSTISVLMNNGDGTFAPEVEYVVGLSPMAIQASDLDNDGYPDIAVITWFFDAHWNTGILSILKNKGNGTFEPKADYPAGNPVSVTAADLDGDGFLDLAAANRGPCCPCSEGSVGVFKNKRDGTFETKVDYPSAMPYSVAASDLDKDGTLDLVVANLGYHCSPGSNVSILKNKGDGSLVASAEYGSLEDPSSVIVADLDGDGDVDLAVANAGLCDQWQEYCVTGDFLSVFLNNGAGTFTLEANYPTGHDPASVSNGDFDGDGDIDLAVAAFSDNKIQIFRNNVAPFYAKGDIDGDGEVTLLDVIILLNCVFAGTSDCKLHASSDVSCDGHLSPVDLVLELRKFFLDIPFPC